MTPKSKPETRLTPKAYADLRKLPGNVRRKMVLAINGLEKELRPHYSKRLKLEEDDRELRRLRLGKWRIIYLVIDEAPIIVGVRQRPPYDYSDLAALLDEIED